MPFGIPGVKPPMSDDTKGKFNKKLTDAEAAKLQAKADKTFPQYKEVMGSNVQQKNLDQLSAVSQGFGRAAAAGNPSTMKDIEINALERKAKALNAANQLMYSQPNAIMRDPVSGAPLKNSAANRAGGFDDADSVYGDLQGTQARQARALGNFEAGGDVYGPPAQPQAQMAPPAQAPGGMQLPSQAPPSALEDEGAKIKASQQYMYGAPRAVRGV